MEKIRVGGLFEASKIVAGCMRVSEFDNKKMKKFVDTCLENGIDMFDHADIYASGKSEEIFGATLKKNSALRQKMIIQSKCGIVPGKRYDFSKEHILNSVEGSLRRLNTDYLDVLLLHRPDTLMEPDEVAAAFDKLFKEGKVKYFGVSNFNSMQTELLKKSVLQPLKINQVQFSAAVTFLVDSGFNVNTAFKGNIDRTGSLLEYARLNDITLQAWSPYQYGFFEGVFIGSDKYVELNETLERLAKKYDVTSTAIASAFILRHPAKMQIITGTSKPERIIEISKSANITLEKQEWYDIYLSAGNKLP